MREPNSKLARVLSPKDQRSGAKPKSKGGGLEARLLLLESHVACAQNPMAAVGALQTAPRHLEKAVELLERMTGQNTRDADTYRECVMTGGSFAVCLIVTLVSKADADGAT